MEKTTQTLEAHRHGCDQCKFCGVTMGAGKQVALICRFNPPMTSATLMMGPQGPSWASATTWPNVAKTDWCSKFEPVLN